MTVKVRSPVAAVASDVSLRGTSTVPCGPTVTEPGSPTQPVGTPWTDRL